MIFTEFMYYVMSLIHQTTKHNTSNYQTSISTLYIVNLLSGSEPQLTTTSVMIQQACSPLSHGFGRQSGLVASKMYPLPGSTPADLHCLVGLLPSSQGVLDLMCGGLPQTPLSLGIKTGHLPHTCCRMPLYGLITYLGNPPHSTPLLTHYPGISQHTSTCTA